MKTTSKYELASPEVQEVMAKPPHRLVLWGNTFILLIIALCLLLLNTITIPRYVWVQYNITAFDPLTLQITIRNELHEKQLDATIFQLPVAGSKVQYQTFRIDSILNRNADQLIIRVKGNRTSNIKNYGEGRMLINRLTIFERILQQFKRQGT